MNVVVLAVGPFQSNCFIVSCEKTKEAIIVDAGDDGDRILSHIDENHLRVKLIVNTHAHIDHVTALAEVKSALAVPVLMHENEMLIYRNLAQAAMMFGLAPPASTTIDRYIRGGDTITFGTLTGKVIDTPGHSPGGISLMFDDVTPPRVFVGDVLFSGSIGRTDLPGADHQQMMRTLKDVVMEWPDDVVVYSGHGPETTIGVEKRTNPFLLELRG